MLSRHKQYKNYWINPKLSKIHTTDLICWTNILKKFFKTVNQTIYFTKESLLLLLQKELI